MDYRDLMNDSLLVAFEKIDQLKSPDAFIYFLFGISIRILSNKNKKKEEERIHWETQLSIKDPGNNPETQADIHFLYQALKQLPDEQRESIILFELSGFSIREIAEIQQAGESAVKQRLKRGREKLVELLQTRTMDAPSFKTGELRHG